VSQQKFDRDRVTGAAVKETLRSLLEPKSEMSDFTPLEQCLLVLAGLRSQFVSALNSLTSSSRPVENEDLSFTVCNHIQILLCSFLDEWKIFTSFGKVPAVRDTLKITSPAINRIRSWTGLSRIRSTLLAHGLRNRDGTLVRTWDLFNSSKSPTAYQETVLLGKLAVLVIKETLSRHHGEYHMAAQRWSRFHTPIKRQGISTVEEANEVFTNIKAKMSEISNHLAEEKYRTEPNL